MDRALDFAVLPGYTRLGFALRGLRPEQAIAGDLSGRTALVTGGSSGIGEEACAGLLAAGATVHLLGRDEERTMEAVFRLESRLPRARDRIVPEVCDISDLSAVRGFADLFLDRWGHLDVLVNNAGVLTERRERTPDGIERTFATNVLGPFLLTGLLLPALRSSPSPRVITVSSGGMYTARLDPDDPQLDRRDFDGPAFYAHSKRAEVVLNRLWSERHAAEDIAFHAMHPGWADTGGLRTSLPRFQRVMRPLLRDPAEGADTIVWLATAPSVQPESGGFWHDRRPRPEHRVPWTRETAAERERLWAYCERLSAPIAPESAPRPTA
ncbi:MAG TPA: SDR family NAD(P)-dependent oxidoreductase [Solirubrobacterales bacterium]|nr:SDR family NAD(P)-dependent oxidoreductase [Solirubrobacterales bacterium]